MEIETITNATGNYSDSVRKVSKSEAKKEAVEVKTVNDDRSSKAGKNEEGNQNEGQVNQKQIENAISQANNKMKQSRTHCEFSYHESTKTVSIKIMDDITKEVIKEIPPEETLKMVEKMWELAGLLVDEKG